MHEYRTVGGGAASRRIAVQFEPGRAPCLVWCGGFRSHMNGAKAEAIHALAMRRGQACLRFDYSGHGDSEGDITQGMISLWLEEAVAVIRGYAGIGPVLVGSSMGAWIALLAAREFSEEARFSGGTEDCTPSGMVLVAPAVDFTERLMWDRFSPPVREAINKDGAAVIPSEHDPAGYRITREFIEDGRRHLLLGNTIPVLCPVHILQGMADSVVPWSHALSTLQGMTGPSLAMTLIKDGDHRLSRQTDIERLAQIVEAMATRAL
jgi:pimeloyl-ACP methyl ester carboxylesterase